MSSIEKKALSFFNPQQLYALVTDIEAYPDFFPWCIAAKVIDAPDAHHCTGQLTFKKKWFEMTLVTENTMVQDTSIDMSLQKGPFKNFSAQWTFVPMGQGSEVIFHLQYQLMPGVNKLLSMGVDRIFSEVMHAFLQEAEKRYG